MATAEEFMPETATEAQKLLAEEAMKSFDFHAKDEQLAPEELAKVLHAAGLAVPLADVAALVDELTELEPTVERQKYQDAIVDRIMSTDPADKDDILVAFRAFDPEETGFLSVTMLRHVLTKVGESVTDVEVDEMLKECEVNEDGNVNYYAYVALLFPEEEEAA